MGRLEIVKKRVANLGNRRKANAIVADLSWALDEIERLRAIVEDRNEDIVMKTVKVPGDSKPWWPGDLRVEPYMGPVAGAISRHLSRGKAWTDIYNRAYEAVFNAIEAEGGEK